MSKENTPKKKRKSHISLDLVRFTFGPLLWLTSWPIYRYQEGAPKGRRFKGRAVITSNHISFHDGIIINLAWLKRRIHILTKREVYQVPFLRWFLSKTESLVIDVNRLDLEGMRTVLDVLNDESIVVVFPQGHIRGDDIGDLKGGAAFFAKRGKAPIIPMYVTDRLRPFRPNKVYLGKVIDTQEVLSQVPAGVSALDHLTTTIKNALLSLKYMYHDEFLKKCKKHERWACTEPKYGDHIRINCGSYHHHGIYISDDCVIEFGTQHLSHDPDSVEVRQTTLSDFLDGKNPEVRKYTLFEKLKKHRPKTVEKIARSRLGFLGYHLVHNNCEHFCNFCTFGPNLVKDIAELSAVVEPTFGK